MPRSNVSFKKMLDPRHKIEYADEVDDEEYRDDSDIEEDAAMLQLGKIERRMKAKKKQSRPSAGPSKSFEIVIEDETDVIAIETIPAAMPSKKNSDSEYEDSIQGDYSTETVINRGKKQQRQLDSTFNSWNDLDYDDEKVELPRSSFVEGGPTPWSNFNGLF
jgi:hypothetical protein